MRGWFFHAQTPSKMDLTPYVRRATSGSLSVTKTLSLQLIKLSI